MPTQTITTAIDGVRVEIQPRMGSEDGAVLHMLPGGTANPKVFDHAILDVYAFTARGRGTTRGGHYHLVLDEFFFVLAGSALVLLSDFRDASPTHGTTIGVILGEDAPSETHAVPAQVLADGSLARLRVPHGVYHAFLPLDERRITAVAIGSTPYVTEDYRYPTFDDVPEAREILARFGLTNELGSTGSATLRP